MHIVGPYLTTTKYNSKKKKSKSKKLAQATAEHDKWLMERGLHPSQRNLQKAFKGKVKIAMPDLKVEENAPLSNKIDGNGLKQGVMHNLHKENAATQQAILDKAKMVDQAYNKGPYMLMSKSDDPTKSGSKSRRM
jgi:hypothetical protein